MLFQTPLPSGIGLCCKDCIYLHAGWRKPIGLSVFLYGWPQLSIWFADRPSSASSFQWSFCCLNNPVRPHCVINLFVNSSDPLAVLFLLSVSESVLSSSSSQMRYYAVPCHCVGLQWLERSVYGTTSQTYWTLTITITLNSKAYLN
jgi:hypothetical protein